MVCDARESYSATVDRIAEAIILGPRVTVSFSSGELCQLVAMAVEGRMSRTMRGVHVNSMVRLMNTLFRCLQKLPAEVQPHVRAWIEDMWMTWKNANPAEGEFRGQV